MEKPIILFFIFGSFCIVIGSTVLIYNEISFNENVESIKEKNMNEEVEKTWIKYLELNYQHGLSTGLLPLCLGITIVCILIFGMKKISFQE
ncbi:hypothetical protein [Nitrosopumilus spindle-shaped virus]|uniref:Uncharacterized protein n=1 Tax=Nitrosopumilus spindle-shaped virus TaxID=2508184 RepID=A0A514K391_9VIRU|nr:hypothetical protein [Nitrosopumilus spindle-shaped virus]